MGGLFVDAVIGQVHKLVCLGLGLVVVVSRKSGKSFFEHIDAQWVHTGYEHVDAKVELSSVDQQWVRHVLGHDGNLVERDLRHILDQVDAAPARKIVRLDDPHRRLALLLLEGQLRAELRVLFRNHEGLGDEPKLLLAVALLHAAHVDGQLVLARELARAGKVVDLLPLVEALVQVVLAVPRGPEQIPVVALGVFEAVCLQERAHEARVALENLVEQIAAQLLRLACALSPVVEARRWIVQQLRHTDSSEVHELVLARHDVLILLRKVAMGVVILLSKLALQLSELVQQRRESVELAFLLGLGFTLLVVALKIDNVCRA